MAAYVQHVNKTPVELLAIKPEQLEKMTLEQLTELVRFIIRDNPHMESRIVGPAAGRQAYIKFIKKYIPKAPTCNPKQQS